ERALGRACRPRNRLRRAGRTARAMEAHAQTTGRTRRGPKGVVATARSALRIPYGCEQRPPYITTITPATARRRCQCPAAVTRPEAWARPHYGPPARGAPSAASPAAPGAGG